jgi:hypothetical protein
MEPCLMDGCWCSCTHAAFLQIYSVSEGWLGEDIIVMQTMLHGSLWSALRKRYSNNKVSR